MIRKVLYLSLVALLPLPLLAQQRSAKRGLGWDESRVTLNQHHMDLMKPGVSWIYNWGNAPKSPDLYGEESMTFLPMCWNGSFNESSIRSYLSNHPETKYLLGFNEPNFSSQSNMTPASAAAIWPRLEKIADDFGLKLVAPALNFSGEKVGGRAWNPYEWLNDFIKTYPTARIDCLALHCYMNWYSAQTWFATEYFYKDLFNPAKTDVYGKYPELAKYLEDYKAANGNFPKMMLTEFCAWENDGTITGLDFQIDQMTQKVQKLEQSDLVEGYAWFMGNATASAYPYMSVFQTNTTTSDLSTLGQVYVNMSSFDKEKYYEALEIIQAKDYVEATTDKQQVKVRPNSEEGSEYPLQIEMPAGAWVQYQVDVKYIYEVSVIFNMKSTADVNLRFYVDSKVLTTEKLPSTGGKWELREIKVALPGGKHDVMLYNAGTTPIQMNYWRFTEPQGVETVADDPDVLGVYDLQGRPVKVDDSTKGLYLIKTNNGTRKIIY